MLSLKTAHLVVVVVGLSQELCFQFAHNNNSISAGTLSFQKGHFCWLSPLRFRLVNSIDKIFYSDRLFALKGETTVKEEVLRDTQN